MKRVREHIVMLAAVLLCAAAFAQYPAGTNKIRLGAQTSGDGLVYRGTLADTTTIKPSSVNNAYFLLDTVSAVLYRYIKTKGGWQAVNSEQDLLHVLEGGANSAGLSISGETVDDRAFLVADANNATPWDGLRVVGYFSQRILDEVTIQGAGLITITETAQTAGGTITIGATIPQNYITSDLLSAGVRDSLSTEVTLEQGGQTSATIVVDNNTATPWDGLYVIGITETIGTEGEVVLTIDGQTVTFQIGSNLSFPDTTGVITLENNQGTDVYFAAGENVALSSDGDTLTISAPLSLSVSQGSLGPAFLIVDNNNSLPWDGSYVVGYFTTATIGVTLQLNNESVTFYPVQDGDKGDITVTGNGENWNIDPGVVNWENLGDVQDSIELRLRNPVDSIMFKTTYEGIATTGEMIWNTEKGTVNLGLQGDIEMPLGQGEAHMVRNRTGSTIAKGKVVYISGATGQRPEISLADADGELSSSVTFGITAEEILHNDTGFVFTSGYIKGVNTTGYTEGEALWLDTVPGGWTHTKYYAPVHSVLVGYVITAKNNGTIFIKVQNGYELNELHNVNVQSALAQDILRYNGTIWQPGKDTSLYNMDGTLKGNRLVSMGTADLQFRQAAGAPDYVQIKKDFVLVGNTNTGYNTVIDQYGIKQDEAGGNDAQIYLTSGEIALHGNQSVDGGLDPDLVVKPNGRIEFRVSAPGPVDSLFGKNSNGELTAVDFNFLSPVDTVSLSNRINLKLNTTDTASLSNRINLKLNISDTSAMLTPYLRKDFSNVTGTLGVTNGGTGLTTFSGAGRVPYSTSASALTFDTTFRVDMTNGNFVWGNAFVTGSKNISIGSTWFGNKSGLGNSGNIYIGAGAGQSMTSSGLYNTIIGDRAGINMTSSSSNTFVGAFAGSGVTGNGNIVLGINSANNTATGDNNIVIGHEINLASPSGNKQLTIGNVIFGSNLDSTGTAIPVNGRIGIRTNSPQKTLHVNGEVRISDLVTDPPLQLLGADGDGDIGSVKIGAGLKLNADTLQFENVSFATVTGSTYTVATGVKYIICDGAGTITITLPSAATWKFREIIIKTTQAYTVVSASSNVIPIDGIATGTEILPATDGAWALLVSDGTAWVIMSKG